MAGIITVMVLGTAIAGLLAWRWTAKTIYELLAENKELRRAIGNLTEESQIGYAKVLQQERRDGTLYTRLLFVETDRDDPARRILQREYEIEGDVVHFDILLVTFGDELVMDGKERALYLWRRVYGENQTPAAGFPIEREGVQPKRYAEIFRKLSLEERRLFWSAIWDLANDPNRLAEFDIKAVNGHAVYKQLRPGLIYAFKVGNAGQFYVETVPDL